jgi:hypothetical protein
MATSLAALIARESKTSSLPRIRFSNPCTARSSSSLNEFGCALSDPQYKIRTSTRRLTFKLLKVKNGSPAWIRTTNLTGF